MNQSVISLVQRFNNWCDVTGVKNTFVNYIWWKNHIINKKYYGE